MIELFNFVSWSLSVWHSLKFCAQGKPNSPLSTGPATVPPRSPQCPVSGLFWGLYTRGLARYTDPEHCWMVTACWCRARTFPKHLSLELALFSSSLKLETSSWILAFHKCSLASFFLQNWGSVGPQSPGCGSRPPMANPQMHHFFLSDAQNILFLQASRISPTSPPPHAPARNPEMP